MSLEMSTPVFHRTPFCKGKALVLLFWIVGALAFGSWMFHGYVGQSPTLVSVTVRGEHATTVRVTDGSSLVFADDRYSDVGNWQRLYFLLPHDFNLDRGKIVALDTAPSESRHMAATRGLLRQSVEESVRLELPREDGWRVEWSLEALVLLLGFVLLAFLALALLAAFVEIVRKFVFFGTGLGGGNAARRGLWLSVAAVSFIRILVGGARGIVELPYDPLEYLWMGLSIHHGDWVGSYLYARIMKSLAYQILLSWSFWLHLPYNTVLDACWLAVAIFVCLAVRPLISRTAFLLLFVALAVCPVQQYMQCLAIQPPFAIVMAFFFAAFCGLLVRIERPLEQQLGWLVAYACGFCLLEFFREERQYFEIIFVGFAALYAATLFVLKVERCAVKTLAVFVMPVVVCFLYYFPVSALNYSHYGFWGTSERRDHDYLKAIGTAFGVGICEDTAYDCRIPVRRELIRKFAEVSPAWRELAPFLDTDAVAAVGSDEQRNEDVAELPDLLTEPKCGWFAWHVRGAIIRAGHSSNWYCTRDFYRRLYGELASAIASGRIRGLGLRAAANPPLTGTVVTRAVRAWCGLMRFLFWDVMNTNIGGKRPDRIVDIELMSNWLESNPSLSRDNRNSYAALLERDTRPSNVVTLIGWGRTQDGQAIPREWFRCPIFSFETYLRPDIGTDKNYGFAVTVPKDAVIEIGDGKNPPLFRGNPLVDRHGKDLNFDIVEAFGETAGVRKRRLLDLLLGGIDAIMPCFFGAVVFSVFWLAVSFVNRRDRESFARFAIPVLGVVFAIGYCACLAFGYVFLQCQYRAMTLYFIPPVTVYWVSGCMAIVFASGGVVRLIKEKWKKNE